MDLEREVLHSLPESVLLPSQHFYLLTRLSVGSDPPQVLPSKQLSSHTVSLLIPLSSSSVPLRA